MISQTHTKDFRRMKEMLGRVQCVQVQHVVVFSLLELYRCFYRHICTSTHRAESGRHNTETHKP